MDFEEILDSVIRKAFKKVEFRHIPKKIQIPSSIPKQMKTLIWLDDMRDPTDARMDWLAYSPIGKEVEVIWLKNYSQFKNWILKNGMPDGICFDHDLGEDTPSGYECAKWLVNYCLDNNVAPPVWSSQSANPVGKANINRLLRNFLRSLERS